MSPTYCPMPWVALNVMPTDISPCCAWEGQGISIKDIKHPTDVINTPFFEKIKQDMLDGNPIPNCKQCYDTERRSAEERSGFLSRRQEALERYGVVNEQKLSELDIRFDNICNLKCRGCASGSSHLWFDDEKAIYGDTFIDTKYVEHNFDMDCSNLTHINISGGEPFLSKHVERFLNKLVETDTIKNIQLGIVTNGSVMPSSKVITAMTLAKKLYLSFSIDGIGELHDYFRSGVVFENILKNIKQWDAVCQNTNYQIIINSTVSIYNVTHIKEIEEYFTERYPHFEITHRMLAWPEQLAVQNMPADLKEIVRPIIENFGPGFDDILDAINTPGKDLYGHFLNFHNTLDKLRNERLPNTLLSNYIDTHQTSTDSIVFFKKQMDILK